MTLPSEYCLYMEGKLLTFLNETMRQLKLYDLSTISWLSYLNFGVMWWTEIRILILCPQLKPTFHIQEIKIYVGI